MTKELDIPAVAPAARSFSPSLSMRLAPAIALALGAVSAIPAHATGATTPTYGLGTDGAPAATDYYSAAEGFHQTLAPLLTAILPVLVLILACGRPRASSSGSSK